MHSAWTLVTLLFTSSAPTVLCGKCNAPSEAGENDNCLGGSYNDCAARNNQLCTGECAGQPAGGADDHATLVAPLGTSNTALATA
ncbi:hypothetical protein BKA60DRAFT_282967 [Fusarium oxysporum]|uniref:Uncharacterized protein n=1 Tax=Fusarium oxysporum TaxID=5507 RepID=A0A420MTI8_FUSOX|nr:hypothetical protein BKA60DRAFT_282967 [Fusarium oxysporum]RKK71351.1 hypothetical protein BFJ69_g11018 [Fusarium oxysporum]